MFDELSEPQVIECPALECVIHLYDDLTFELWSTDEKRYLGQGAYVDGTLPDLEANLTSESLDIEVELITVIEVTLRAMAHQG